MNLPSSTPLNSPKSTLPYIVGRYELLLPIASGGMGMVYLARVSGVGGFARNLALKLMHPHMRSSPEFVLDLVEEAKLAARIHHPNVVAVLDAGEDEAGAYLVMEYVEGDSVTGIGRALAKIATGTPQTIPARIALRIVDDALAGLHAAHELKDDNGRALGIVHRDFSPQNILVGIDGHSRLVDFGIAKAANRVGHTQTGLIKGKVSYMSPEQARAEPVDRRSDVWAAGVVIWEMLAGRRLYKTDDDVATAIKIINEVPPRLREARPDLPPSIDEVVASALTVNVDERCPNVGEFRRRLALAAKDLGGFAEPADVAAFLAPLVEEKLAKRKARIEQLRTQREKIPQQETSKPSMRLQLPLENEIEAAGSTAASVAIDTGAIARASRKRTTVIVLALALVLVPLIVWGGTRLLKKPAAANDASVVATPESAPMIAPSSAPLASASASADAPADSAWVTISSQDLMRAVQIDARAYPISPPAKEIALPVPETKNPSREVVATSVDGRLAHASLATGSRQIDIAFAAAVIAPVRTPTPHTNKAASPRPKHELLDSPFADPNHR
jgi:serine/threonine protein kinase